MKSICFATEETEVSRERQARLTMAPTYGKKPLSTTECDPKQNKNEINKPNPKKAEKKTTLPKRISKFILYKEA